MTAFGSAQTAPSDAREALGLALLDAGAQLALADAENYTAEQLDPDVLFDIIANDLGQASTTLTAAHATLSNYQTFAGGNTAVQAAVVADLDAFSLALGAASTALFARDFDAAQVALNEAGHASKILGWEGYLLPPVESIDARCRSIGITVGQLGTARADLIADLPDILGVATLSWVEFQALVEEQSGLRESPYNSFMLFPSSESTTDTLRSFNDTYEDDDFSSFVDGVIQDPGLFVDEFWPLVIATEIRDLGSVLVSLGVAISGPGTGDLPNGNSVEDCPQWCTGTSATNCGFCGFVVGSAKVSPSGCKKVKKAMAAIAKLLELEDIVGGPVATRNQIIVNLFTSQVILPNRTPAIMQACASIIAIGTQSNPGGWAKACWDCCEFESCWDWWPEGGWWLGLVERKQESDFVYNESDWIAVPPPLVDPMSSTGVRRWSLTVGFIASGGPNEQAAALRLTMGAALRAVDDFCAASSSLCN